MPDNTRGKTGNLPENNAVQIFYHQRRAEGLATYAPMVVPHLKDLLLDTFGSTPGYGVDDNIDVDSDTMRYGWRIFGTDKAETHLSDEILTTTIRKTLIAVELLFGEGGLPVAFLVDTRRTRTTVKTGLLGLKQRIDVTLGEARKTSLNEAELKRALIDVAKTMEK